MLQTNCAYLEFNCRCQLVLIIVDDICVARSVKLLFSEFPEETSKSRKNSVIEIALRQGTADERLCLAHLRFILV